MMSLLILTSTLLFFVHVNSLDFEVIDLTHTIGPEVMTFPFYPPYNITPVHRGFNERWNIWLEDNYICMPEHIVITSMDAPAHKMKNRPRTHELPLDKLVGPGVIINVKTKAKKDSGYRVTVRDLRKWEKRFGKIPYGALVIMNSGWDKRYPNSELVYNTKDIQNTDSYKYPTWSLSAAEWLLKNRRIIGLGVDTPTLDALSGKTLPVHLLLFKDSLFAVEGVANLDSVPQSGSTIYVPVLKTYGGSGGPARVFATAPKKRPPKY